MRYQITRPIFWWFSLCAAAARLFGISFFLVTVAQANSYSSGDLRKVTAAVSKKVYECIPENSPTIVFDIQDMNNEARFFGKYFSNEIHLKLAGDGKLKVLDRSKIPVLIKEQELAQTGLIDENQAVKFGEMIGAKHLIYGNFVELGQKVELKIKVLDIEKGIVLGALNTKVKKTPDIERLLLQLTKEEIEKKERDLYRQNLLVELKEEKAHEKLPSVKEWIEGIDSEAVGYESRTIPLTLEPKEPIPVEKVSAFLPMNMGKWNEAERDGESIASYSFHFESGGIGNDPSAIDKLAKEHARKLGCDTYYHVSYKTNEYSDEINSAVYRCVRTENYSKNYFSEKYLGDLFKTEIGKLMLEGWRSAFADFENMSEQQFSNTFGFISRGKWGKLGTPLVYRNEDLSIMTPGELADLIGDSILVPLVDTIEKNFIIYKREYELISLIQDKYRGKVDRLWPLETPDKFNKIEFVKNMKKILLEDMDLARQGFVADPQSISKKALMADYFNWGVEAYKSGDYMLAIKAWENVLKIDPSHGLAKAKISKAKNQIK